MGDSPAIESSCTWDLKAGELKTFDENKLANIEPELYLSYILPRESYTRITITRKQN